MTIGNDKHGDSSLTVPMTVKKNSMFFYLPSTFCLIKK